MSEDEIKSTREMAGRDDKPKEKSDAERQQELHRRAIERHIGMAETLEQVAIMAQNYGLTPVFDSDGEKVEVFIAGPDAAPVMIPTQNITLEPGRFIQEKDDREIVWSPDGEPQSAATSFEQPKSADMVRAVKQLGRWVAPSPMPRFRRHISGRTSPDGKVIVYRCGTCELEHSCDPTSPNALGNLEQWIEIHNAHVPLHPDLVPTDNAFEAAGGELSRTVDPQRLPGGIAEARYRGAHCPSCKKDGKGLVAPARTVTSGTMLGFGPRIDGHVHDPNTYTDHNTCPEGHKWTWSYQKACHKCGFLWR